MMASRIPETPVHVFRDTDQQAVIREMRTRLQRLEQKAGLQGSDADMQSPVAPPPPNATLNVTGSSGRFTVSITNPQYEAITASKRAQARNQVRAPIEHELSRSAVQDFSSGVTTYPASTQTYWEITLSGTWYWRLRSSFDGQHWNSFTRTGAVTA